MIKRSEMAVRIKHGTHQRLWPFLAARVDNASVPAGVAEHTTCSKKDIHIYIYIYICCASADVLYCAGMCQGSVGWRELQQLSCP